MSRPLLAVCKHGHDLTLPEACSWDVARTRRWCRRCVEHHTAVQNERRKFERLYVRYAPRLIEQRTTVADLRTAIGLENT